MMLSLGEAVCRLESGETLTDTSGEQWKLIQPSYRLWFRSVRDGKWRSTSWSYFVDGPEFDAPPHPCEADEGALIPFSEVHALNEAGANLQIRDDGQWCEIAASLDSGTLFYRGKSLEPKAVRERPIRIIKPGPDIADLARQHNPKGGVFTVQTEGGKLVNTNVVEVGDTIGAQVEGFGWAVWSQDGKVGLAQSKQGLDLVPARPETVGRYEKRFNL